MNKVFRVIWSEAQGAWVAVSETTKSHSKRSRKAALALALAAGGLLGVTGYASATTTGDAGTGSIAIGPKDDGTCSAPTDAKGEKSISIGCETGSAATGDNQTNLGYQAGSGSNGDFNTALGTNTGERVNGDNNTAVGLESGKQVTGSSNAAVGNKAGSSVTGNNNVSFGSNAGDNTKGNQNVAVGFIAGAGVKGSDNAAFGSNAGEGVDGNNNTGFGRSAGKSVTGNSNTSLGNGAGMFQNGNGNLSAGLSAGQSTHGDHNIMLGNKASTVGSTAGATINRTVVIGSEAKAHADDTVALGTEATAKHKNTVALGSKAKAEHENSVALGHASQTAAAAQVNSAVINTEVDGKSGTFTYSGFAGTASGVVSVGSVGAERQIINVAPGAITSTSTDAVNGSQLYGVAAGLNKRIDESGGGGWNVVTSNTSTDKSKVAPGAEVDFVSSDKNVAIKHTRAADGNTSIDFALNNDLSLGVDGTGGVDGKIAVNGKDGVSGVTIDGKEGSIGLTGPAGANGISPTLTMRPDIKPGDVINNTNSITRITYKDADGNDATLATLENDGLRFSGNDNTDTIDGYVTRLLNKEMQIKGGATIAGSYSSANIKTVATQAGGIEIQFAETPNFKGADMGGQQITSVGSGLGGQALTEITGTGLNNAVNVSDLQNTATGLIDKGFNITAENSGFVSGEKVDNVKLGETVAYTGEDGNITTTVKDNQIDFALSDDLKIGSKDGTDGKIAVNGKDGVSGVTIDGKDGSIGLTGPAGANGTISVTQGVAGLDGTDGTRLVIDGNEVATMKDGLKFAGNTGATIAKELNDTLTVKGELADDAEASGANLRVDSGGGQLNLVMAKDLTDINSITINNGGPVISGSGIDMGGLDVEGKPTNKITNLAPGTDGTDAVNVDQLTKVATVANAGWNVATSDDGSTTASNVAPGAQVDFVSSDKNVAIKHTSDTDGNTSIDFALSDDLKIGSKGGTDGKIAVNGKDGSSVVINGADGSIGLTGPTGANGISPTLTMRPDIKPGDVIKNTNSITRITYKDADGKDATLATLENDGLRFSGNDNTGTIDGYVTRLLNKEMQIIGGGQAKDASGNTIAYSSGNVRTVATQDGGIEIQFAETPNFKGADMGSQQITSVGSGLGGQALTNITGTDLNNAVNVSDLQNTATGLIDKGFNIAADNSGFVGGEKVDNVKLGETVAYIGEDGNITTTVKDNQIDFALSDDLKIGSKDGTDGKIAVNGKDGSSVVINGADGSIGLTGPAGANGTISVTNGVAGVDGKDGITRIVIDGNEVATMKDGLKFAGNTGATIAKELNDTLTISGGLAAPATDDPKDANASGANLRVDSDGGQLNLVMAKDLTDINSITINNGGPVISGSGIDMGGLDVEGKPTNKITNLAPGTDGTDAVNVDQLTKVATVANAGWKVATSDDGSTTASKVAPGAQVDFVSSDKNVAIKHTSDTDGNTSIDFALSDDLKIGSKGGTDGKIAVNGKDGSSVVINGADGSIGLTGPAGTNGISPTLIMRPDIKLGDVINNTNSITRITYKDADGNDATLATLENDGLRFSGNNNPTAGYVTRNLNQEMQIKGGATRAGFYSSANIKTVATQDGGIEIQIADSPKFGDITINNAGKISGVEAGVDGKDAVNVDQLKDYVGKNNGSWNISDGSTSSEVKTGNTVTIAGNNTGTTAGNINVTNDGNGNLTIESNVDVKHDNVTVGGTTINKDTGITVGDTNINNQGDITVGDKVSVKNDGVTVGDVSITVDGGIHAGDKKITGVDDGTIAAGSKDAVNGGQIHDMQVEINRQAGGWELKDGKGGKQQVKAGDSVAIVGSDNINVEFDADDKMVVATNPNVEHNSVTTGDTVMNGNGVTIKDGPSITKNGVDAGDKKITSVDKGEISETSTDAINGSQLYETNNRVTKNEGDIKNIQNGKDGMFQVSHDYNALAPEPTGNKSAAGGAGAEASGDNSTAIGNDAKATASNSTALGNSALASANNSVALGQGSVADRANSVSVGTVGGERQITNVAAGVAPTDAVNVSQLDALGSKVNQYFNAANKRIDKVDNNARAGIAAAMAAGTLPQSTLPGKSMVTVGASTYRGESALAIGVSRLSDNARTVIKANASADSRGNAGAAVGAGWHW